MKIIWLCQQERSPGELDLLSILLILGCFHQRQPNFFVVSFLFDAGFFETDSGGESVQV
jgi:hypothetical protein